MYISASLLAADLAYLGRDVRRSEQAGVDSFHFDVMDGHYVPNIALSPSHLCALRPHTRLPFHVHLELSDPAEALQCFQPWHADAIIVCRNTLTDPQRTFALIRSQGARVGLSLDPRDNLRDSAAFLPNVDLLVMLAVLPGFGGQPMQPDTVARVAEARHLLDQSARRISLAVDGGVTPENAPALLAAGADMLIVGTALFQARSMGSLVAGLRALAAV